MIAIKHWKDFDEDRKNSDRILVIYGASKIGHAFMRMGIIPNFFCDRKAHEIKTVSTDDNHKIPVLDLDKLSHLEKDMDILVGINPLVYDIPQIIEDISSLFLESCDINIYHYFIDENIFKEPLRIADQTVINMDANFFNERFLFVKEKIFDKNYCDMLRAAFFNGKQMTDDDFRQLYSEGDSPVFKNNKLCFIDRNGKYISYFRGKRHTLNQPDAYNNTIYVFGDSREYCIYSEDQFTVCSQLQVIVNYEDLKYRVENEAIGGLQSPEIANQIKNTKLKKGDIVFLVNSDWNVNYDVFLRFVQDANDFCKENGSIFVFIDPPTLFDRINLSPWEKYYLGKLPPEHIINSKNDLKSNRMHLQLYCTRNGILFFNFDPRFYDSKKTIFIDRGHWGDYGNQILASQLFEIIQLLNEKKNTKNIQAQKEQMEMQALEDIIEKTNPGCENYVKEILENYSLTQNVHSVGAIVMNCNPFTKGHRYLIEQVVEKVEFLYIFVVEEDKSEYPFEDRFNLVKENTQDLPNVIVVPSGKFIISSITFPGYFSKELTTEQTPDASLDLLTFALKIAPILKITTRFVGEEPYCMVTKSYNEQMKNILPKYGIDVVEISRVGIDGDIISASKVRLLLKDGKMKDLEKYVPEATLTYLMQKQS